MRNFLYAWELEANFGHVGSFGSIAQQLKGAGHTVSIECSDLRVQVMPSED